MNKINLIIDRLKIEFLTPAVKAYFYFLSFKSYLISLLNRDSIVVNEEYDGDHPVLLLALYEDGKLRLDIVRLLECAKILGMYSVVVNTKKISDKEKNEKSNLLDAYIERYNFGRDFGSYKCGFTYIFDKKININCKRVIMLNDSLYYDSDRTLNFLNEMLNSDVNVLGATENYEFNYHLGSFAISFSNNTINQNKFIKYWRRYKNTDIRPTVIRRGELGLSKCLIKITKSDQIKALYNQVRIRKFLEISDKNIEVLGNCLSHPESKLWSKHLHPNEMLQCYMEEKEIHPKKSQSSIKMQTKITQENVILVSSLKEAKAFLKSQKFESDLEMFENFVASKVIFGSRFGSQIHANSVIFLIMGLPIIKLDGLFRGVWTEIDMKSFKINMSARNYDELISLLYAKPYGFHTLSGWKRVAYSIGYL